MVENRKGHLYNPTYWWYINTKFKSVIKNIYSSKEGYYTICGCERKRGVSIYECTEFHETIICFLLSNSNITWWCIKHFMGPFVSQNLFLIFLSYVICFTNDGGLLKFSRECSLFFRCNFAIFTKLYCSMSLWSINNTILFNTHSLFIS
jgi:hypothetical protein